MSDIVYCGVDFHARVQTVAFRSSSDGQTHIPDLDHRSCDIRAFYAQFSGEVIVAFEASGFSLWFDSLLEVLGHQVWIGHPTEIRRCARSAHKSEHRDAELILDLLSRGEFPRIHRADPSSLDVLRIPRLRHRLVKIRTRVRNSLLALAKNFALTDRSRLLSKEFNSFVLIRGWGC